MTPWDYSRLKQKGYGRGSILKCRMHNFLTYDEVEVFPGPKLNVLLGPNGTGKSAITHAICLACAGRPSLLGRSDELAQFVKRGKETDPSGSFVEIDILLSMGEVKNSFIATVRRTLSTTSGASKYLLNGRNSTQREVKELMASLNIDIGNLCSFMPQDKVGKFAAYTPKEVLQNTLRTISCSKSLAGGAAVFADDNTRNNSNSAAAAGGEDEDGEEDGDGTNLYEVQMKLAAEERAKISLENDRTIKEREVQKCQHDVDALEPFVRAAQTREKLVEIKNFYDVKRRIVSIQDAEAERKKAQKLLDDVSEELVAAERVIEPLVTRERDCRRLLAVKEKELNSVDSKYKRAAKTVGDSRDDVQRCGLTINTLQTELRQLERTIADMTKLLTQHRVDEARYKEELDTANNALRVQNVDVKLQQLQKQINGEFGDRKGDIETQLDELRSTKSDKGYKLQGLKRQLLQFKDPWAVWSNQIIKKGSKFSRLLQVMTRVREQDAEFRQRGQLKGPVYGPIGFHCRVADPASALMLENAVAPGKWMQCVVTNDHDCSFIQKLCKDENLFVDVAVVPPTSSSALERRLKQGRDQLQSRGDFTKKIGIQGLLLDALECPDTVKTFLMDFAGLSTTVYRSSGAKEMALTKEEFGLLCPQGTSLVRVYHQATTAAASNSRGGGGSSSITQWKISRSKFDNAVANGSISAVGNRTVDILFGADSNGSDQGDKQILEGEMKQLENDISNLDQLYQAENNKLKAVTRQVQGIEAEVNALRELKKQPQKIHGKLSAVTKKISEVEEKLRRSTSETERQKKLRGLQDAMSRSLKAIKATVGASKVAAEVFLERAAFERVKSEYGHLAGMLEDELEEARESLTAKKQQVADARRARDGASKEFEKSMEFVSQAKEKIGEDGYCQLMKSVIAECGHFSAEAEATAAATAASSSSSSSSSEAPTAPRKNSLGRDIPPAYTVEAVEVIIATLGVEIENIIENNDIFARHKRAKEALATSTAELAALVRTAASTLTGLDDRIREWCEKAGNVISKLNSLFVTFMAELSYQGEVSFVQTGTIDNYEVGMRVAFRNNEDMVALTAQRQSGGEKSVATIMYLMALQGLTTSPFRVVDEINQGMDERNERLVIDRIVKSCCSGSKSTAGGADRSEKFTSSQQQLQEYQNHKPQYFLVSPKLLQALRAIDHPDVTVLMVWNGPGVKDNKWQITDMIKVLRDRCKRQCVSTDDVEFSDDEDAGDIRGQGSISQQPTAGKGRKRSLANSNANV